jgi:hypothetical protein
MAFSVGSGDDTCGAVVLVEVVEHPDGLAREEPSWPRRLLGPVGIVDVPAESVMPWVYGICGPRGTNDVGTEDSLPDLNDERMAKQIEKKRVFDRNAADSLRASFGGFVRALRMQ